MFYKYVFKSIGTLIGNMVAFGGPCGYYRKAKEGGVHLVIAAILEGCCEASFTLGIMLTSAANNLIFINANPLWCAVLGYVFFREKLPVQTIVALLFGFACIIFVFWASEEEEPAKSRSTVGDIVALSTGIMLSLYLTTCRHAGMVKPSATMVPASLPSSLISLAIGAAVSEGEVGGECIPSSGFIGWLPSIINGGIILPICLACFAIGPKYIFGSETGLIMLLEVLLGPLWVWLVYLEAPSIWTFCGGGALLLVLALHEAYCLRSEVKCAGNDNAAKDRNAAQHDENADVSTEASEREEYGFHDADEMSDDLKTESGSTLAQDRLFAVI
eukprot:TRINITY_DN37264_c0_g1_i1.p1 TRINITY_DN37264_c0_g1~~TRINITY_DN37264_c0_g1_i1.p1  ORF type:complete len:385 (-),score=48.02 TRINITY_DN37264_c0_g1_i1:344-1333(-)